MFRYICQHIYDDKYITPSFSLFLLYLLPMKKELTTLDLSTNETSIYQAILKTGGSASAGDIIKITDLHRNIVYDSLSHLINKKLVREVMKDKKKYFTLKDPSHLKTNLQQKMNAVDSLSKTISQLAGNATYDVTVHEGSVAWQQAWQRIMKQTKPGATFHTLGMAGDTWVSLMGETFVTYEQWALKNKITDKIISQKYLKEEIEAHQNISFREIQYIDIDLPPYVSIEIFDEYCFFENYSEPATLIEIRSKGLAQSMRAYFNLLWSLSNK